MISRTAALIFTIVLCVSVIPCPRARAEPPPSREYLIKAAFLYKFTNYVDWPVKMFPDERTPLVLCILGEDPFDVAIKSIKDKKPKGRNFVIQYLPQLKSLSIQDKERMIQYLAQLEELKQCHMLFISASEEKYLTEIFRAIKGRPILTVGEMKKFAHRGGVINLVVEDKKVRLEINPYLARSIGLVISSKLLKLAKIIDTSSINKEDQEESK